MNLLIFLCLSLCSCNLFSSLEIFSPLTWVSPRICNIHIFWIKFWIIKYVITSFLHGHFNFCIPLHTQKIKLHVIIGKVLGFEGGIHLHHVMVLQERRVALINNVLSCYPYCIKKWYFMLTRDARYFPHPTRAETIGSYRVYDFSFSWSKEENWNSVQV